MSDYPAIEAYPPLLEPFVRQVIPGIDLPLDWVIFLGTGLIFDSFMEVIRSKSILRMLPLVWALLGFWLAAISDRRGKGLTALFWFNTGWVGGMVWCMLTLAYLFQLTELFLVVMPLLSPVAFFLGICAAVKLSDCGAPAALGWVPRQILAVLYRYGRLPDILTPASFKKVQNICASNTDAY